MEDRRQVVRWHVDRQAKIEFEGELGCKDCIVNDINYRGARISLPQNIPKDKPVKVKLTLCEELGCLNIEMWVVWHREVMERHVYGLYFTKIKDNEKENIYKFMRKYFPHHINKQWWRDTGRKGGGEMSENNNASKDRRIFERFAAKFPVKFVNSVENKEGEAQVCDVSAKGLGIVANEQLTLEAPLEMWLQIPDRGEPLYTRGEVVWAKEAQAGQWRAGIDLEKADLMGMSRAIRA